MALKKNKSALILKSLEEQLIKTGGDPWFDYYDCDDDYYDGYLMHNNYNYDGYWNWYDDVYHRNRKIEEILGPNLKTTLGDFMKK